MFAKELADDVEQITQWGRSHNGSSRSAPSTSRSPEYPLADEISLTQRYPQTQLDMASLAKRKSSSKRKSPPTMQFPQIAKNESPVTPDARKKMTVPSVDKPKSFHVIPRKKAMPRSAPSRINHPTPRSSRPRSSFRIHGENTTLSPPTYPYTTTPPKYMQSSSCTILTPYTKPSSYTSPIAIRRSPWLQHSVLQQTTLVRGHAGASNSVPTRAQFIDLESLTLDKSGVWEEVDQIIVESSGLK